MPKRAKLSLPQKSQSRTGARLNGGETSQAAKWSSPRGIRPVHRPERAPTDELMSAIASPTPSLTSGATAKTPEELINYIRNNRPSITSETTAIPSPQLSQSSRKDPLIDPALEHLTATSDTQLSQDSGDISTTTFKSPAETKQAASNELESTSLLHTFQKPKDRPMEKASKLANPQLVRIHKSVDAQVPKPNVDFTYRVILARKPIYQYQRWKPKGRFLAKSLAELCSELPIQGDYEALKIRMQGPATTVREVVQFNNEGAFEKVKSQIDKIVRSLVLHQTRTKPGTSLSIDFEIEPLKNKDDSASEDESSDEAELEGFEW